MNYGGQERRKFPRASFPCKLVVSSPVRLLTSHTENLSEGGIRVILEEKLNAFTSVGLEVFFEKDRPVKCKGKVIWVREKINPLERQAVMFDTGIKFIEMSDCDKEYIRKLIDSISSPEGE